ncbi:MAG: septal ring lytic transglycosylase RlpA family protein [Saprospirales bacterium]|nr:septal ring lytic transglycosylase RlpA family protein [Saprospirales bacterium]
MKKSGILFLFIIGLSFVLQAQEYGLASYYSDKFQGRPTASGELYDKDKMTAAHKTHPYGTYIKVTRLDNKKSVVVRVNDRGPYISGRVIDVSKKAADQLGLVADGGTARVKVEVVQQAAGSEPEPVITPPVTSAAPKETPPAAAAPVTEKPKEVVKVDPPKVTEAPAKVEEKPKATTVTPPSSTGTQVVEPVWVTEKNFQSFDLYKIELYKPEKVGYAVQVASMTTYDNAMRQIADLQGKWLKNVLISIEKAPNGTALYKILLGPFPDKDQADDYRKNIKSGSKWMVSS